MIGHQMGSLKRKEPEDLVQDLLNVSLSAPKRFRSSDSGVPASIGLGVGFASQGQEMPWSTLPAGIPASSTPSPVPVPATPSPILHPAAADDQKALVLYRPVTPPLFPGGPPVGSVDFPYKVNAAMLQTHQGTDSELSSQLDCQSAFSVDKDTPSGHGLFQALDLSGGPIPHAVRRLNRVSSCSSLPRFAGDMEDHVMVEEVDRSATNLAVIPWVPMTPVVISSKARPVIEEVEDEAPEPSEVDEMIDGDSMEVVNEDDIIVAEVNTAPVVGQFGSPLPNFGASPWQAEIHQPPYTQAMWSH